MSVELGLEKIIFKSLEDFFFLYFFSAPSIVSKMIDEPDKKRKEKEKEGMK